jgi:hypothetical protein
VKVNEFLDTYFGAIKINTPFNIFQAVYISKHENKLGFDLELIVEDSDIRNGFIKPKFSQIYYQLDRQTKIHDDKKT